jgi:N6-L-threonylcarbamoyladenine synthase
VVIALGIETSCDETAAAVAREDGAVLANAVRSQIARHGAYGGVVPEIAARAHVETLPDVVRRALREAGLCWSDIDAVAATRGPGLATSLAVGFQAAKALALRLGKPLLGIHHLEAHVYSILLGPDRPPPDGMLPALVLLVSGGHTALVLFAGAGRMRLLARTVDDAAGEALDKGAKLLGLPYPGGPEIERLAENGNPHAVPFPRGDIRNARRDVRVSHPDLCFSFSGLKTALLYYVREHPLAADDVRLPDIAASYQQAVVDTLAIQVRRALDAVDVRSLGCAGGVARNGALRRALSAVARDCGIPFHAAEPDLCTDNAAMVAALGAALLARGTSPTSLGADILPTWPLGMGGD